MVANSNGRLTLARPSQEPDDEAPIDVRAILLKAWHGKWIIAICVLIAGVLAFLTVSQFVPVYRATAKVMFGLEQQANLINAAPILQSDVLSNSLQNEIEVLQSTSLIERVVDRLSLEKNSDFNPFLKVPEPTWSDTIRNIFSVPPEITDIMRNLSVLKPLPPPAPEPDPETIAAFQRGLVIASVRAGLSLQPVTGSRVINLSFTATDPVMAAKIANTFAEQFIVDQLEARLEATRAATTWLSDRVDKLKERVQVAEEAVQEAIAEQSIEAGQSLEITKSQLAALNSSLSSARNAATAAEATYNRLKKSIEEGRDYGAIPEFRNSVINGYRAREAELISQRDALKTQVGKDHPALVRVQTQLKELANNINAEAARIVEAARTNWLAQKNLAETIEANVRELETKALEQSRNQVAVRQLEREANASRVLYESLLSRLKETSAQGELQTAGARILSPAVAPTRPLTTASNRTLFAMLLAGGLIGIGIVFLLDKLNNTFRSPTQLEELTHETVLGTIPSIGRRLQRQTVLHRFREKPKSALAESIRNLRTSILFSNVDDPPKVVMFTSSVTREGKSTTSMLMAVTSQQMGKSAIIVDCDLRLPSLARLLDKVDTGPGLLSLLEGATTLEDAIFQDAESGLHVLMTKPSEPRSNLNAADLLSSQRFKTLLTSLREKYDLVILDAPPTLVVADARILSKQADAVVYAVRWDHTPRGAVLEGLRDLHSMKAPVAGVILTMVNEAKATKYAYDGYAYYRGRYRDYYVS